MARPATGINPVLWAKSVRTELVVPFVDSHRVCADATDLDFVTDPDFTVQRDRPLPSVVQGALFQKTINQEMSVRWSNVPLRDVLNRITAQHDIAVIRDRRLNPDKLIDLESNQQSVQQVLENIAREAGGRSCVVGNTVYFGPESSVDKLRTLIALRREELSQLKGVPRNHRSILSKNHTVHWQDLDRPAQILDIIAAQNGLMVQGQEQIPHDLCSGGTFIADDATAALSLILIQFDLTFRWQDRAAGIELIPIPKSVSITRSHTARPLSARQVWNQINKEFPTLQARLDAGQVIVEGTLEQHEAIDDLLHPKLKKDRVVLPAPDQLDQKRITLRVMGVPARALMQDLEKRYQLKFQYDKAELTRAGVDLGQKVEINVMTVPLDEYLQAIFTPLGADVQREGRQVTITAATVEK